MNLPGEFEGKLDENPDNCEVRLAYASWLDEHNKSSLASAQRWMAHNNKRPWLKPASRDVPFARHVWFAMHGEHQPESYFSFAVLLQATLELLPDVQWSGNNTRQRMVGYFTRRAAEQALATALSRAASA